MKKALMNASVASMIYQFNMNNIAILKELGYRVDVACNFGKENPISEKEIFDFREILKEKQIKIIETVCPRSILAVGKMIATYRQLRECAGKEHYDLVHTQSPIGGVVCRLAFRKARKHGTKVIYQAHGFHFYKGAPIINWLIFYPIEALCSYFTDVLITINQEDYKLAKRKLHAKKTVYVPGVGLDMSKFHQTKVQRDEKRTELGITSDEFVFLSVGELNENKNHATVIRALGNLKKETDITNIKYLICGKGDNKKTLETLIRELDLSGQVKLLGFRKDVSDIYKVSDAFVFPSFREGLSMALMEAMCCGLPVACSSIRGNVDLIDETGGKRFNPHHVDECEKALVSILNEKSGEAGRHNAEKVRNFSIENVSDIIRKIYKETGR